MLTLEQWSNGKVCSVCNKLLEPNYNKNGLQCVNPVCKNYAASIAVDAWREAQAQMRASDVHTKEKLDRVTKTQEVIQAGGTQFSTGAVRSSDKAGVRYDLITPIGLRRIAETYKEGTDKYGAFNWEKGMPISDILNHAIAHIYQFLSGVESGEDDLAHAAWNLLAAMHMQETHPNLDHELRTPCTQKTSE